jgi:hypothetical protein
MPSASGAQLKSGLARSMSLTQPAVQLAFYFAHLDRAPPPPGVNLSVTLCRSAGFFFPLNESVFDKRVY